jgi:hypothetical protein
MTPNKKRAALGDTSDSSQKCSTAQFEVVIRPGVRFGTTLGRRQPPSRVAIRSARYLDTRERIRARIRPIDSTPLSWPPSGESEKADQLTGDIQSALACRRRSTWIR